MPAYSFQKRFVSQVESGEKTHTIRGKRKLRPQPGQRFVAFTGMRTKQCRKLFESTITRVQDILIEVTHQESVYIEGYGYTLKNVLRVVIDGDVLADDEIETLARRDGFADAQEMGYFWPRERCPFVGDLIHWRSPKERAA